MSDTEKRTERLDDYEKRMNNGTGEPSEFSNPDGSVPQDDPGKNKTESDLTRPGNTSPDAAAPG